MKYILGIGLNYKKYKKDATIKIYLNDELIEIYQLTNNIESIKVPTNTIKKIQDTFKYFKRWWFKSYDAFNEKCRMPSYIKLIEVDESEIGKELRIEVKNDDSNYTNGFMTKSSTIEPNFLILAPKKLLENYGKFFFDFQDRLFKKHWNWFRNSPVSDMPRPCWPMPMYYDIILDKKNKINKLLKDDPKQYLWYQRNGMYGVGYEKNDDEFTVTKKVVIDKWLEFFKTNKTLNDPYVLHYHYDWPITIGGSFDIILPISKKHGIYFLNPYKLSTHGVPNICLQTFAFAHYFCNKYDK
jgi:hypothetical protein